MDQKILVKILAVTSALTGAMLIIYVVYPIASYERVSQTKYPQLVSPVSEVKSLTSSNLTLVDFTKASNWFVGGAKPADFKESRVSHFTLSIPKLDIENATVTIGGDDLSEYLIQYPGTASPGKLGNTVVFGHSILPQFYNPENYLSIFSTLPTLEEGDEIKISYDGVYYTYEVESMFEVLPTDLQVLDQQTDDSYLSLITCTPPGHPLKPKRLIVRAKVVPLKN